MNARVVTEAISTAASRLPQKMAYTGRVGSTAIGRAATAVSAGNPTRASSSRRPLSASSSSCLHTFATSPSPMRGDDEDGEDRRRRRYNVGVDLLGSAQPPPCTSLHGGDTRHRQIRRYHATNPAESATLVLALGAVAATAKAGQYGLRAYEEYKAAQPEEPAEAPPDGAEEDASGAGGEKAAKGGNKADDKAGRGNIFRDLFGFSVGSKYYEGGFEEKMTRREAALILGVRESASAKRIKDAHRRILILNHPDTGGSTYMASKINEAKELLLKGKE